MTRIVLLSLSLLAVAACQSEGDGAYGNSGSYSESGGQSYNY